MKPSSPAGPTSGFLQRGLELLQARRYAESAKMLRQALDLAPADAAVAAAMAKIISLARTWLTGGQPHLVLLVLGPLAESSYANGTLLMLYGHASMSAGRQVEAQSAFRRWLEQEPGNRDAALMLAAVLSDTGHGQEAETLVRAEIARSGASPQASFVLGRSLLEQARFDEAEAEFRQVVHANPGHQTAQANLMEVVWMRTGDVREASRALDRALRTHPQLLGLRLTKARLLISARLPHEALSEVEAGLAIAARDPALLAAAATIALDFDGARALGYAKRLNAISPQDRATQVALGNAWLATGRARDALEIATALHRSDPTDGQALALRADALRMLGDHRYRELLDYTHFVRAGLIDVPDGWTDLAAYLRDLVRDLKRTHTLTAHPIGNSLREGSQVQIVPQKSEFASIRAFPQAIDGPIRRYLEAIGYGPDPMRSRNTGTYQLAGMWSVRLRPHGFHVNHYHPQGWISSACYLELPPALAGQGGEGWLKFGEPAFPTEPTLESEYLLKPQLGLLVLFPSYMWHGTIPFSGAEGDNRLTIAFDVLPGPEHLPTETAVI